MLEIQIIFISFSLIFAIIAAYLSIKSLKSWQENDMDVIKAKVFLDKSFLNNNFKLTLGLVWIMIGFISVHLVLEYLEFKRTTFSGFDIIYFGVLPVAMLSLVGVTYIWYKVLSRHQYEVS